MASQQVFIFVNNCLDEINKKIKHLSDTTQIEELYKLITKEVKDRKEEVQNLRNRFNDTLSGLETSIQEFDHVAKKFKREKSDMQIMKDNLMISIERLEEKNNNSNIAIENVALHWAKVTELLAIFNDLRKNESYSKNSFHHERSLSLKYSK